MNLPLINQNYSLSILKETSLLIKRLNILGEIPT